MLEQERATLRTDKALLEEDVAQLQADKDECMAQLRDMSTQLSGNSAAPALPAGSGPPTPRSAASRSSSRPSTSRSTPAVGQVKVGIGMVITDLPPHRVVQVVAVGVHVCMYMNIHECSGAGECVCTRARMVTVQRRTGCTKPVPGARI